MYSSAFVCLFKNFKHLINTKEHGTKKYKAAPKYIIVKPEECNIARTRTHTYTHTPLKKKALYCSKNTGCL